MIAKILKAVSGFPGVRYNTNKVDNNKGELLKVANFGPLQGFKSLRPQDYINYLQMLSKLNTNVRKPQFHAVISAKGQSYGKDELCRIAESWLKEMGYGDQPYLVIFHKDTDNNHVHVVTTRVDREGHKISSAYEKLRSLKALDKVLGYSFAMQYRFSTKAQFYMIMESFGFPGKDFDAQKLERRINAHRPDPARAFEIRQILSSVKSDPGFVGSLRSTHDLELKFHSAENKVPYGYTIIDHRTKSVFKGSEVMPLKELFPGLQPFLPGKVNENQLGETYTRPIYVGPVRIADDIDDEAIHGRNRRRKKKARTNTR
jgi:hypothetical protein